MNQTTHPPYAVEDVTAPGQPDLPAPDPDENDLIASVAELGIDVRVWR